MEICFSICKTDIVISCSQACSMILWFLPDHFGQNYSLGHILFGIWLCIYQTSETLWTQDLQMTHCFGLSFSVSNNNSVLSINHFIIFQYFFSTAGYWTVQSATVRKKTLLLLVLGFTKNVVTSLLFGFHSFCLAKNECSEGYEKSA